MVGASANAIARTIVTGYGPLQAAVRPAGMRAHLANCDEDRLWHIDTATQNAVTNIPIGRRDFEIAAHLASLHMDAAASFAGRAWRGQSKVDANTWLHFSFEGLNRRREKSFHVQESERGIHELQSLLDSRRDLAGLVESGWRRHRGSDAGGPAVDGATQVTVAADYGKLPMSFEANQGQADRAVRFLARGQGYGLFLTATEAVLTLRAGAPAATPAKSNAVIRMRLAGANRKPQLSGVDLLPGTSN